LAEGMPVTREGRYVHASLEVKNRWLRREIGWRARCD